MARKPRAAGETNFGHGPGARIPTAPNVGGLAALVRGAVVTDFATGTPTPHFGATYQKHLQSTF
jgi:hypothetical protein